MDLLSVLILRTFDVIVKSERSIENAGSREGAMRDDNALLLQVALFQHLNGTRHCRQQLIEFTLELHRQRVIEPLSTTREPVKTFPCLSNRCFQWIKPLRPGCGGTIAADRWTRDVSCATVRPSIAGRTTPAASSLSTSAPCPCCVARAINCWRIRSA
jgi:hypothetical protein